MLAAGSSWSVLATLSRESIGIAAAPDRVLITNYNCGDPRQVISVNSTGASTMFASLPSRGSGCYEDYLAISPGLGGFPVNHVYVDQGPNIVETDPYGTYLGVFATIPSLPSDHNGITFDHVGAFGFDMILTGSNGQIWRVNHLGIRTLVTTLAAVTFEGPEVAPVGFGSFGGDLFLAAETNGTIVAISPTSTVTVVGSFPLAESIRFIPPTPCNFGTTGAPFFDVITGSRQVIMFPSSNFTGKNGNALVTGESTGIIGLLYANGTIASFASGLGSNQEGSAFVDCSLPTLSPGFSINYSGNITIVQGGSNNNTIRVGRLAGFSQSVSLSCTSGLPLGATCSFNPPSSVPTFSSTLTISSASSTPLGSYTINVTGTGGGQSHTTRLGLNVVPFDFGLSNSAGINVIHGSSGSNTISANLVGGGSESTTPILLSCSGLPAGASCSFNPSSGFPAFTSNLTISTITSTPAGSYNISVNGIGGGVTRTTQFTLLVTLPFNFSLSNSGSVSVAQGGSGSNTITATLVSGTSQSVSLTCSSGLPSMASCSFNPSLELPTYSSSLTIGTTPSTPTGSYTITVTGTGGGVTHVTQFRLTVSTPVSVGGSLLPVDKLGLLAPYLVSVSIVCGAGLATTIYFRTKRKKGHSSIGKDL